MRTRKVNLVITKTPLRVSFAGGGTDFKNYFELNNGRVITSSINKYVYVTVKRHEFGINPEKYRLNYYSSEHVNQISSIKNKIIKNVLIYLKFDDPLYISTVSDIPAYSGLGSSSAFTVGLLRAIHNLMGKQVCNEQLAKEACDVEINLLKSPIGMQDQYSTACGGFKEIIFSKEKIHLNDLNITMNKKNLIFDKLMFFSTKIYRSANEILEEQNAKNKKVDNIKTLNEIKKSCQDLKHLFTNKFSINEFGEVLNKTWKLKKKLSTKISTRKIDQFYQLAVDSGAIGGKINGAGGGGFLMLVVPKEKKENVRRALHKLVETKISFDKKGSRTLYSE